MISKNVKFVKISENHLLLSQIRHGFSPSGSETEAFHTVIHMKRKQITFQSNFSDIFYSISIEYLALVFPPCVISKLYSLPVLWETLFNFAWYTAVNDGANMA